jgi:transposase
MDRDSLEQWLEQGLSLEEIGRRVGRHPSTVGYWVAKHGLVAVGRERHRPRGGVARTDLEARLQGGESYRQIAAALGVSLATVRYWIARYGLRSEAANRRQQAKDSRGAGLASILRECPAHGLTTFLLEGRGTYRCKRCRAERVARRRREVKAALVSEAGGCCRICGYRRYVGALQFHHLDPGTKRYSLSMRGITRSLAVMRQEAAGCVLLCANCHAEVEAGVVNLSVS